MAAAVRKEVGKKGDLDDAILLASPSKNSLSGLYGSALPSARAGNMMDDDRKHFPDLNLSPDALYGGGPGAAGARGKSAATAAAVGQSSSSSASSSSSSSSASGRAVATAADEPSEPSMLDKYQYVVRRGAPPRKDRTWGGDVLYYPGWAYLGGLMGGSAWGVWADRAKRTPDLTPKLKLNSIINSAGRIGSISANGLGVMAVLYATSKHSLQMVRDRTDMWNNVGGVAIAGGLFFSPKGWARAAGAAAIGGAAMLGAESLYEWYLTKPQWARTLDRNVQKFSDKWTK